MRLQSIHLTETAEDVIQSARSLAKQNASSWGITPLHVFSALLDDHDGITTRILHYIGASIRTLKTSVESHLQDLQQSTFPEEMEESASLQRVLNIAFQLQKSHTEDTYLSVEILLLAITADNDVKEVLQDAQIEVQLLEKAIQQNINGMSKYVP